MCETCIEVMLTELVYVLRQDREGASDTKNGQWLRREAIKVWSVMIQRVTIVHRIRAKKPSPSPWDEQVHSQRKDDTAEPRAQDNLNGAPRLARQRVQVARKGDAGQQVGEEDVDGAGDDLLVEDGPVRDVAALEVDEVFFEEPKGPQVASSGKVGRLLLLSGRTGIVKMAAVFLGRIGVNITARPSGYRHGGVLRLEIGARIGPCSWCHCD